MEEQAIKLGDVRASDIYAVIESMDKLSLYYLHRNRASAVVDDHQLMIEKVEEKTPNELLAKLIEVTALLDRLLKIHGIEKVNSFSFTNKDKWDENVYIHATEMLDALVELLRVLEPDKIWGDYYENKAVPSGDDKVSSDIFAYSELLRKRFELLVK